MSLRIAIITPGAYKNENDFGGAASIHNFIKELSQSKEIELTVFSLYYPLNQPEYKFYNAKVFSFGSGNKSFAARKFIIWRKCEKKFTEEYRTNKFDLIHSLWSRETGFITSRLSRKLNIPFITGVGGGELANFRTINYGSRISNLQKYFVDKCFEKAIVIISGSDYISHKIKKYYDSRIFSKVKKLPFGADENMFKVNEKYSASIMNNKLPILINIANAVPVKSHETLFKALKIVSKKFPEIILECYGRDEENILKSLSEKYEVSENIRLNGFIEYEIIPEKLTGGRIFVLSSLYESQNMAVIEAALCGLPVVSTDVGIALEITENLVKPGDFNSLAEKIIHVIENYSREKQNALTRREFVVNKFSLKNTTRKFIDLYKSIL